MRTRHTFTATIVVALLAIAGVTAAIAADPPPPRIVFVANGRVPADALAAGPTAGQLGAPIYTTEQDSLPQATSDALDAYNPQLVIVLGGPVAISDNVVNAISSVTGLAVVDPSPPPSSGVVRAAGADRFATAAAIGDLLGDYNPAALPADAQAVDSDLLDGKDSSEFLSSAAGSVGTDEVADGSLRLTDMAVFSEKITVDPPAIAGAVLRDGGPGGCRRRVRGRRLCPTVGQHRLGDRDRRVSRRGWHDQIQPLQSDRLRRQPSVGGLEVRRLPTLSTAAGRPAPRSTGRGAVTSGGAVAPDVTARQHGRHVR